MRSRQGVYFEAVCKYSLTNISGSLSSRVDFNKSHLISEKKEADFSASSILYIVQLIFEEPFS